MRNLFDGVMGILMLPIYLLILIGTIYWLWMAIQLGSFLMFLIGLFPLCFLVTGPVGAWSLLFGVPGWVLNWFG